MRNATLSFGFAAVLAASWAPGCSTGGPTAPERKEILDTVPEADVLGKFGDGVARQFEVKQPGAAASPTPTPVPGPAQKPAVKKKAKARKPEPTPPPAPVAAPAYTPRQLDFKATPNPLRVGEKQTYQMTYMGVPAGYLTLEIQPFVEVAGRRAYHAHGQFQTSKLMSLMYRMDDSLESFFDAEGFFSLRYEMSLDESSQVRRAIQLFDSEKQQVHYWNRFSKKGGDKGDSRETLTIPQFAQDVLSSFYYLRVVASRGEPGTQNRFVIVDDGKASEAVITVIRREELNTPIGRLPTVVIKPETYRDGQKQQKEDSFLWLSDDDRRLLLRMEAKVKIGTVAATIQAAEAGAQ